MARRYDSEAVRNRVLSTSVRLFLERGYHGTTMAAILKEADVSSSSFQNVFGNKDGVMYKLMKLMFSEQFSAADSAAALLGPNASPAFAYALETSVQLTIAELSEIIRDLYCRHMPANVPWSTFAAIPRSIFRNSSNSTTLHSMKRISTRWTSEHRA